MLIALYCSIAAVCVAGVRLCQLFQKISTAEKPKKRKSCYVVGEAFAFVTDHPTARAVASIVEEEGQIYHEMDLFTYNKWFIMHRFSVQFKVKLNQATLSIMLTVLPSFWTPINLCVFFSQ